MATPTPEQIQLVQANIVNMQELNDYIHDLGQDKILNAFLLLTEPDNKDPGRQILLDIFIAAMSAIGSLAGGVGVLVGALATAAATMLSNVVSNWYDNPPPSLNGQFADYVSRFGRTTLELDTQLAMYHDNVAKYWDTPFAYNMKTMTLSDLATGPFPSRSNGDTDFETLAAAALTALDQQLWSQMLAANYFITDWITAGTNSPVDGPPPAEIVACQKQTSAMYIYWSMGGDNGSYWFATYYTINKGRDSMDDNRLNNDACKYLFQDLIPGQVDNPNGLFDKAYVFKPDIGGPITRMGVRYISYNPDPDPQMR